MSAPTRPAGVTLVTPTQEPPPPDRWPWQRSLQTRMAIAYGGAFLLILALLTFWLGRAVYNTYLDAAEHDLEVAAFLAANALEDPLSGYATEFEQYQRWEAEHASSDDNHKSRYDERYQDEGKKEDGDAPPLPTSLPLPPDIALPRLQGVANVYANDSGARVTILDKKGHPVADSQYAIHQIAVQRDYPEIRTALAGAEVTDMRADPLTGAPTLFAAAPIQQGSEILGVVQLSKPMQVVAAKASELVLTILLAGIVAVLASTLLAVWISRQLVRPVLRLEQAALAAAQGDLAHQVPVQSSDELGALARAFNFMVGEVRTMLDQQRAFVANASHELRTPLTNIKLRIEAVRSLGDEAPDLSARYLAEIESEADRLARLANALLDLSHLESGLAPPPETVADLAPVLHNAGAILQLRAQAVSVTLAVTAPDSLPVVKVHLEQIEEAILNLLDNAIKYTPPGGKVKLSTAVDGRHLLVRVTDTGAGVPAEDLPYIFDRFYRADKVRSRVTGGRNSMGSGAGLGLSIVKELIEQNHGRVVVENTSGRGTTFVVSFPLVA
ncbi:MAG: HAMP domain-containing sensor histidine kinase [Caldilinea sp.]